MKLAETPCGIFRVHGVVSNTQASAGLRRRHVDGPWGVLYWERGPDRDQSSAPSGLDCTGQGGKDRAGLVVCQCLTKPAWARCPFYREGGKRMFCMSFCLPLHPCVYLLLPENLTFFPLGRITFYSEPLAFLYVVFNFFFFLFEHSLALPFFGIVTKTDLFQSCGHCWVFQICWHIECSTFTQHHLLGF